MRYLPQYRNTKEAIEDIRLLAPSGERVSLAQLCKVEVPDGASEIYREEISATSRSNTACAAATLEAPLKRPSRRSTTGEIALRLSHRLGRRIREPATRPARLMIIIPLTLLVIFMILYSMFGSMKWAGLILANVSWLRSAE